MASMSTTLRSTEINHAVMQTFDPNDWAAFETAALHRLPDLLKVLRPRNRVRTNGVPAMASHQNGN